MKIERRRLSLSGESLVAFAPSAEAPELLLMATPAFEAVDVSWLQIDPDSGQADLTAPPPPPHVTVVYPNGGERWRVGRRRPITWTSSGVGSVDVALSRDDGASWIPLAAGTPDDGSFTWTVRRPPTGLARVRVSASGDASVSDASDAVFRIRR